MVSIPELTTIQSIAEFFGWDRDKAIIVKQTKTEIAPNGTRRERRINNDFIPSSSEDMEREVNTLLNREARRRLRIKERNKN